MSLSIVVVSWRSAPDLRRLVESMNRHLDPGVELVVVDNASLDDPEAEAGAWPGPRVFERLDSNRGYGAAANVGVGRASGDAIVMLNPDTELCNGGLERLAQRALARGALTGPRLLDPGGGRQPSASGSPVGIWPWIGAVVPGAVQPPAMLRHTEPWRLDEETEVAWLTGACVAGSRDVLRALGPFDPSIHLYGEDIDLGLRARSVGVSSLFCPGLCRVVHHRRGSSSQRFADGPWAMMEANRRAVLRRAYGAGPERRARRAQLVRLRARVAAKRALGRSAEAERAELSAALSATPVQLSQPPPRP